VLPPPLKRSRSLHRICQIAVLDAAEKCIPFVRGKTERRPMGALLSRTPTLPSVSPGISTQYPLWMRYELLRRASSGSEGTGVAFSSGDGSSGGPVGLR
jgi:hypothetical protein